MIVKANGEKEPFKPNRLLRSLMNSGAKRKIAKEVLQHIESKLYDGISTKKIYSMAFKYLRKIDDASASRYETRKAVIRLGKGHQGFSFEQYMGKVFERMGYKTKTNQIVLGKSSISHEIDLVIEKSGKRTMVECKHISKAGYWINIQTPLYVYARFLDLKDHFDDVLLVTNARFSNQSELYAESVQLDLLSWNYPKNDPLKKMIDDYAVYPITVLKTVNNQVLTEFLERDIVTVAEILAMPSKRLAGMIGDKNAAKVRNEASKLVKEK